MTRQSKKEKRLKIKESNLPLSTKEMEEAFGGDIDLLLFFVSWLKNNQVAKFAYKELHPNVTDASAEVLGSKTLSRIKPELLLPIYSLDVHSYLRQLAAGLDAVRKRAEIVDRDDKGRPVYEYYDEPDHIARKPYHDKLGKLLGLENAENIIPLQQNNTQINNFNVLTPADKKDFNKDFKIFLDKHYENAQ